MEVNQHLDDHFHNALPMCEVLDFRNRELVFVEDGGEISLEIDSFAYMKDDGLLPGKSIQELGILTLDLPDDDAAARLGVAPPAPAPSAANVTSKVDKYIIGESYGGTKLDNVERKARNLEEKITKMVQRYSNQSGRTITDTTSLVGAAILSFLCPMGTRRATFADKIQAECWKCVVVPETTPHLHRLARSRRFFLCVLSSTDGAHASSLREICNNMESFRLEQDAQGRTIERILNVLSSNRALSNGDAMAEGEQVHHYGKI